MIEEHECEVLTKRLPDESLEAGDIGTVVHIHKGGMAYEVEFVTLIGETVGIVTLEASQIRFSIAATLRTRGKCRQREQAFRGFLGKGK